MRGGSVYRPHPYFNPRTREGCDKYTTTIIPQKGAFQSTHPRGVRREMIPIWEDSTHISIHAPARGATRTSTSLGRLRPYFNPRTREGCDYAGGLRNPQVSGDFNPRTREGCDSRRSIYQEFISDFNPRTREGCDAIKIAF